MRNVMTVAALIIGLASPVLAQRPGGTPQPGDPGGTGTAPRHCIAQYDLDYYLAGSFPPFATKTPAQTAELRAQALVRRNECIAAG